MPKLPETLLQELFDTVLQKGKKLKERECEHETERDESYISGFRNYTTMALLELQGLKVEVTQVDWRTYCPSSDQNGTRFSMRILKNNEVVFSANREGASIAERFGAGERYIGQDQTPSENWKVVQGQLPKELKTISV